MTPLQVQAERQSLERGGQALQARAEERNQQFEATRRKALNKVLGQAQPFVDQAVGAHACGLVLSREAVLGGNMGNDLTNEVVAALDAKVSFAPFDLEPSRSGK